MAQDRLLKRFGKYLLLDHLVDGGMAAIYRSRELAEDATKMVAEKIVAIKVIKEEHSQDENFKEMFLDEIKVAFALTHPNIAQTYNYGEGDNKLFAVLEYVDGRNLKEFIDALKKLDKKFPVEMAAYITTQICQGLDYAHKFKDKLSGKEANIIHRDISPHNVMLDYDGIVKVIDFGIAKADSSGDHTKTGTIKGKVSYIAPEYLAEDVVLDHRYDQFAVGLILWELLTGDRIFNGKNDMAVLRKIYECKIPKLKDIRPDVPEELETILRKSLSRNRERRYEDMDKFNRDLTKFLNKNYSDFHSSDLKDFLHDVFKESITKNVQKLRSFGEIDVTPYFAEFKKEIADGNKKQIDAAEILAREEQNFDEVSSMYKKDKLKSKKESDIKDKKEAIDNQLRDAVKKMIFGQTSITDENDKTISDFIQKQRSAKNNGGPIPSSPPPNLKNRNKLSIAEEAETVIIEKSTISKTKKEKKSEPLSSIKKKEVKKEEINSEKKYEEKTKSASNSTLFNILTSIVVISVLGGLVYYTLFM